MKYIWILFISILSALPFEKTDYNVMQLTQNSEILDYENKIPVPRGLGITNNLQLIEWPIGETITSEFKHPVILLDPKDSLYFDFLKIDMVSGYSIFSNIGDSVWTKDEGFVPIERNRREYVSNFIKTVESLVVAGRLKLFDNFESVLFKVTTFEKSFYKDSSIFLLNYNPEFASIIKIAEIYSGEVSFEISTLRADVNTFIQLTSHDSLFLEPTAFEHLKKKNAWSNFSVLEDGQINLK